MSGKLSSGLLYIILIIFLLTLGGMTLTGGIVPINKPISADAVPEGDQVIIKEAQSNAKNNLQLQTFGIETCQKTLAVDFLIDTSGSMSQDGKLGQLRQALSSFVGKLSDNSVVGMQAFSTQTRNIADINYYKNNKNTITSFISTLRAQGGTSTRDGFTLAQQKLSDAITQNKFPGYNYSLIFISDGFPTSQLDRNTSDCLAYKSIPPNQYLCFSKREDPRTSPDLSQQIKDLGVKIFSIEVYGKEDAWAKSYEDQLFQDISSKPLDTYYYETLSANDLPKIFDTISNKVCQ